MEKRDQTTIYSTPGSTRSTNMINNSDKKKAGTPKKETKYLEHTNPDYNNKNQHVPQRK